MLMRHPSAARPLAGTWHRRASDGEEDVVHSAMAKLEVAHRVAVAARIARAADASGTITRTTSPSTSAVLASTPESAKKAARSLVVTLRTLRLCAARSAVGVPRAAMRPASMMQTWSASSVSSM
jgi:hypothetical protein